MATSDQTLSDAKQAFQLAYDAESDNREAALDDLRFARLGEQWPEQAKHQRETDGRPCLTINRMPTFIRQVVNDARMNKPAIKCHPADDVADPATADILNGLIRNIEYTSNAEVAYDTAMEYAVTMGFGYWRVGIDYAHDDSFDLDIRIERIANPFSVYGDPHSTSADSSDWDSAFVVDRMSKEAFRSRYKGAEEVNWDELGYGDLVDPWVEDEELLVAEYWSRSEVVRPIVKLSDGSIMEADLYMKNREIFDAVGVQIVGERNTKSWKVIQRIMTGAEVLEENDWAGRYIPVVPVYGDEVNVEGKRYLRSLIRDAKDAQRIYNYWRTTSTELVALAPRAPWIGPKGSFSTDIEKWTTANISNHSFIEYDGAVPPQRQPFAGPPAGALQEALNASDDIKSVVGLYDAALGARSNETSGRAILARQREGDVSTYHYIDNLSRAIRHTGRILVDLIPSVYGNERIIRVLGQDDTPTNVPLGRPVRMEDGTERIYDLASGKYDITVEAGPSFTTKREEAATQMIELIRANPQIAPIIGDLLVKNLDWPGADEIAKRLQAMLPQQLQGQNPQLQQAQMVIEQLKQALGKAESEAKSVKQDHAIDLEKVKVDAYNAETNRLKAVRTGMSPEQVQAMVMQTIMQVLQSPDVLPMPQRPTPPKPMPPMGGPNMPRPGQQNVAMPPQPPMPPMAGGPINPTPTQPGV